MCEDLSPPQPVTQAASRDVVLRQPASLAAEYVEGRAPEALRATATAPPAGALTYYGLPPIKRPHWGWQVPAYFWVGGVAAGSYLVALLAALAGRPEERTLVRWGRYLSLLGLAASPILLIGDLGRPERFHHMLRIFKTRSMVSVGSWVLTGLGAIAGPLGLAQLAADLGSRWWALALRGPLHLLGAPLAVLVATYTGVLLSATSVPLWAQARLHLASMFFASALATGAAALGLAARPAAGPTRRRLAQVLVTALGVELAQSAMLERRLGTAGRALGESRTYRTSQGLGLLSLALLLPALLRGRGPGRTVLTLGSLATLAGGFALRWAVVEAGKRSADRPEHYFAWTQGERSSAAPLPAGSATANATASERQP